MDHVIDAIGVHLDIRIAILTEDWQSGKYRKLSDCPPYEDCRALVEAIHCLERHYYGESQTPSVRELVKFEKEEKEWNRNA